VRGWTAVSGTAVTLTGTAIRATLQSTAVSLLHLGRVREVVECEATPREPTSYLVGRGPPGAPRYKN
jgi:hypothetical protein